MTPNFNLSYKPDFSNPSKGYYRELEYQDGQKVVDPSYPGRNRRYSIFDRTLYTGPSQGEQALLSFGLDNTVEAKVRSDKDTTGTGYRKIPIIQGLNFSGSYNFLAPAFKLSTISFSGRSQFTDKLGINYNGTLNPYQVGLDTTGSLVTKRIIDKYTIPRLTSFGFSFDYSLNAESFKRRNENIDRINEETVKTGRTPEQDAQLRAISRDPNAFVDFNIPWNFAFAYSFQYSTTEAGTQARITNALTFNGDFNLTEKLKVQFNSGYDFEQKGIALTNIAIYRDLHCWDMSINWVPFGYYKSYSVTIKVKASILQDLKLSKQQGYYSRYD